MLGAFDFLFLNNWTDAAHREHGDFQPDKYRHHLPLVQGGFPYHTSTLKKSLASLSVALGHPGISGDKEVKTLAGVHRAHWGRKLPHLRAALKSSEGRHFSPAGAGRAQAQEVSPFNY